MISFIAETLLIYAGCTFVFWCGLTSAHVTATGEFGVYSLKNVALHWPRATAGVIITSFRQRNDDDEGDDDDYDDSAPAH